MFVAFPRKKLLRRCILDDLSMIYRFSIQTFLRVSHVRIVFQRFGAQISLPLSCDGIGTPGGVARV